MSVPPKVCILAATELELRAVQNRLGTHSARYQIDYDMHGVGFLPTCFHLATTLSTSYEWVIQIGIAGSYAPQALPVGSVAAIYREHIAVWGAHEKSGFRDVFDMGLMDKNAFPFEDKSLPNPYFHLLKNTLDIPFVEAVSADEISVCARDVAFRKNHYRAQLESMEGAAFHYCARRLNIRFVALRAVSNVAGERDKRKWDITHALDSLAYASEQAIYKLAMLSCGVVFFFCVMDKTKSFFSFLL